MIEYELNTSTEPKSSSPVIVSIMALLSTEKCPPRVPKISTSGFEPEIQTDSGSVNVGSSLVIQVAIYSSRLKRFDVNSAAVNISLS